MCTINISALEVNRQVFWQANYLNSLLKFNLSGCNILLNHPNALYLKIVAAHLLNKSQGYCLIMKVVGYGPLRRKPNTLTSYREVRKNDKIDLEKIF